MHCWVVQETSLASAVSAHKLQAAEGPGTTAFIELCLRIPPAAQSLALSIAFQKAFLSVFDHPPDAYRGFDMPAALVTILQPQPQPLHQVSLLALGIAHVAFTVSLAYLLISPASIGPTSLRPSWSIALVSGGLMAWLL